MKINNQTFGEITLGHEASHYSGIYSEYATAANQPRSMVMIRPASTPGEYLAEVSPKWIRADGTTSRGFKLSLADITALNAELNVITAKIDARHAVNLRFANNAQIWD